MNKSELIADVALRADITKKDADAAVNAVIDSITNALEKGDKVQLVAPLRCVPAAPVPGATPATTRRSISLNPRPLPLRLARL